MDTRRYRSVVRAIELLRDRYGCFLMKLSTEDEALTHDEVRRLNDVFRGHIDIELKIGGPTARGDLRLCRECGIHRIIAPLVESDFALREFLEAATVLFGKGADRASLSLGVNIETSVAYRNIEGIINAGADKLKQVTVGRSDLSKSLGQRIENAQVTTMTKSVVRLARSNGCFTSVGGGIHPGNIQKLVKLVAPDGINTRNFAFRIADLSASQLKRAVANAIAAELLLCLADGTVRGKTRLGALLKRIKGRSRDLVEPELNNFIKEAGVKI